MIKIETVCQKVETKAIFPIKIIYDGKVYFIKKSNKGIYMNCIPQKEYKDFSHFERLKT